MGINVKKKGNIGENNFANWLYDNTKDIGGKAWRDNGSGGGSREKGDINNNLDLTIEIKTVKKLNLKEAWKQVKYASVMHHNTPVLAVHFDNMPKNKWLIVQDCDDWLYTLKELKKLETEN